MSVPVRLRPVLSVPVNVSWSEPGVALAPILSLNATVAPLVLTDGLPFSAIPVGKLAGAVTFTFPAKPPVLFTNTLIGTFVPGAAVTDSALNPIEKSGPLATVTTTEVVAVIGPDVPAIVTV